MIQDSGDEFPVGVSAEHVIRAIAEQAICDLDEAASVIGRIHRCALTEGVVPHATQLHYLHKAWSEIGQILSFLNDVSLKCERED